MLTHGIMRYYGYSFLAAIYLYASYLFNVMTGRKRKNDIFQFIYHNITPVIHDNRRCSIDETK